VKKKKKPQPENPEPEQESKSESPQEDSSKRDLVFDVRFLEDLTFWVDTNRKIALRLLSLVEEIGRNPFEGTGRPGSSVQACANLI
jgi:toxin YoeB